jgi:dynein heavy chain, axonemal
LAHSRKSFGIVEEFKEAMEKYRPVAARASLLYSCLLDLGSVDPMYQYSLDWFKKFLQRSLKSVSSSESLDKINAELTYSFKNAVELSLLSKHKFILPFLIAVKITESSNALQKDELRYFLSGCDGQNNDASNPTTWLS